MVNCGHGTVPWPVVLRLSGYIIRAKRQISLFPYAIMPPVFSSPLTLRNSDPVDVQQSISHGVIEILVGGHDLDATDPRDKISVLLQFGTDMRDVEQLPTSIKPGYNKPAVTVFADFTRWWIRTHKSFRICPRCTPPETVAGKICLETFRWISDFFAVRLGASSTTG